MCLNNRITRFGAEYLWKAWFLYVAELEGGNCVCSAHLLTLGPHGSAWCAEVLFRMLNE